MSSPSSSHPPQQPRRTSSSFKDRVGRKMDGSRARTRDIMEVDLPERFQIDEPQDVNDGTGVGDDRNPVFAHQSIYGMIAATQSTANFMGRFQPDNGSESEENDGDDDGTSKSTADTDIPSHKQKQPASSKDGRKDRIDVKTHGRNLGEDKLARSFLNPIKEQDGPQQDDPMTQSQLLPPRVQEAEEVEQPTSISTDAPILDRKLQAMAKAEVESSSLSQDQHSEDEKVAQEVAQEKASMSIPEVIAQMFQFDEPERVVSEFRCWYTQNILLQGFMYITQKHICFYSYLEQKTKTTLKQGQLGQQAYRGYLYRQYWFVLEEDTFSYFKSSAEPFFREGFIDLRDAISADVSPHPTGKDATDFTITTPDGVYYFRAESPSSARDWVKQLQKAMFRIHNEGDSVKLLLPIDSILDVEETKVSDVGTTVKVRSLSGDDTFAVDEYFFTFFDFGKKALKLLNTVAKGSSAKRDVAADEISSPSRKMQMTSDDHSSISPTRHVREPVRPSRSTLSASGAASPQLSKEDGRSRAEVARAGASRQRTSFDRSRSDSAASQGEHSKSPPSSSMQQSTESFSAQGLSTSTLDDAIDPDMSASQMLVDDGIFDRSTVRMPQSRYTGPRRPVERLQEDSDSSLEPSAESARIEPPPRQPTHPSLNDRTAVQRPGSGGSGRNLGADDKNKAEPVDIKGPGRLVRGISMPLQHAKTVADMVRDSGKRVGSYLSSSPKTYITNWSEAFVGGRRHYTDVAGLAPDDSVRDLGQDTDVAEHERRFRRHFKLPETEKLQSVFYCWLHKTIPLYGKIYMGTSRFCFRSLVYGSGTQLVIPYKKILNAQKQRGFRWGSAGMILVIRGYEELFFDFPNYDLRDDAVVTVIRNVDSGYGPAAESMLLTAEESQNAAAAAAENDLLLEARKDGFANLDLQSSMMLYHGEPDVPPIVSTDPALSRLNTKPKQSLRIVCMTIGSRGDVQPFIALCKGLLAQGHRPKIATHAEFKPWIEKHGIEFAEVAGDPAELMRICVDNGMFSASFIVEAQWKCRAWLDKLLASGWAACRDAEILIESPVAMAGIHIAEALQIPYFRAFGMPWTRTRAYPHAFAVRNAKAGGNYNYVTYTILDNLLWKWPSWQINYWRRNSLGLPNTSYSKLQTNKVPFLYNFSPNVVIPPLDFSEWVKITGYWFLDEGTDYQPPQDLANFIKKARDDGYKLVYVGFGSVTVNDSKLVTQNIVNAVVKADVRCILSKGWSDRLTKEDPTSIPIKLPSCIHQIRSAPHDWLFKQVDAVVHHGGAGTTGASLRAGIPTIIFPFFGDQNFWATRVEDLGVGQHLKKLTANALGKALWMATHDDRMRRKASFLGQQIRAEDGVDTAIQSLWSHLEYAKSLIKRRGSAEKADDGEGDDAEEENWTFVDQDLNFASVPESGGEEGEDEKEEKDSDGEEAQDPKQGLGRKSGT